MISATSPIYVSILGRIFLKEVCGVFEVFVVTFIMFGVLIVMQPPMIFMHLDLGVFSADELQGEHEYENRHFWIAGLVLIGTVFSAISMVASRALKVNTAGFISCEF